MVATNETISIVKQLGGMSPEEIDKLFATLPAAEQEELVLLLAAAENETDLVDPVEWMTRNFYVPELLQDPDGPALQLAEYQERCLREALSRKPDGTFKYSIIVWSDLKKSIKSTITAAVAMWRAYCVSWGQVMIVANDLKQADSRVGYYIRRAIDLNPAMKKTLKMRSSGYEIFFPNNTRIESVPIDPTGEAGGNADMVVFSELWGSSNKAQQRMWTEMTLSPTKRGQSFRWVESYAGYQGESIILEQLYEVGVRNGKQIWPDLEAYVNEAAGMFCLWNTQPRLPWQTPEYYAQEAAVLTAEEFDRVHRNKWVTPTNAFVPGEWLDSCSGVLPAAEENEPLIIALDAGTSSDNFGIVGVTVRTHYIDRPNGETYIYKDFIPRIVELWIPQPGEKLLFTDPIDPLTGDPKPLDPMRPAPETVIRRLAEQKHVVMFVYDPYQLHNMAHTLQQSGVGYFVEMNQNMGGKRAKADKNLYDLIRDRRITINDHRLDQHLRNANASPENDGLRLKKRSATAKIDLAVCLSMACYEAMELNLG
jgi:hypothetical protein